MKYFLKLFGLFCFLSWLVMPDAHAAVAGKRTAKNLPTNITAGRMQYDANKQIVVFIGNVHVKRTDFELWAKEITVYLAKKTSRPAENGEESTGALGGMEAGEIDRIVAQGDVRMKSERKEGRCQTATYYASSDKFVMEGSPVLTEDKNSIRGTVITHYLSDNRSEVSGAEANFIAPDKTTPKKN